ncbi:hypothetical protein ACLKA6_014563 [Drosophila palustris]
MKISSIHSRGQTREEVAHIGVGNRINYSEKKARFCNNGWSILMSLRRKRQTDNQKGGKSGRPQEERCHCGYWTSFLPETVSYCLSGVLRPASFGNMSGNSTHVRVSV